MAKTSAETRRVSPETGAPDQPIASREEAHAIGARIIGESAERPEHARREAPPRDAAYVALRTFDYGRQPLDRGQVFHFSGLPNDARLRDLRYATRLDADATTYECPQCGARFTSMGLRDGHAKVRHAKSRFVPPPAPVREPGESIDTYQNRLDEWAKAAGAAADSVDERRDKLENEVAPLDLSQTAASRS